jgi:hypothetical protein
MAGKPLNAAVLDGRTFRTLNFMVWIPLSLLG